MAGGERAGSLVSPAARGGAAAESTATRPRGNHRGRPQALARRQRPGTAAGRQARALHPARGRRRGLPIILTSTTYVGTTRELLTHPLAERGLRAGCGVYVAFSPERIDPGNPDHAHRETPRVAGGVTQACAQRAAAVISLLTDQV